MVNRFKALGPDDDGMTYLPIDKSRAAEKPFGPTDPRGVKGIGGARFASTPVFVLDEQMGQLDAAHVAEACDNIVQGKQSYASLCYLGRCRVEDLPALHEASQSYEIKVRWERLWVLSPFFSRLSRSQEGREAILRGFEDDLAGVHLLSKFAEQNNPAVKRLFARLHDPLLAFLLARLHQYHDDPRRAALLAGIIGTLETHADVLRSALPPEAQDEATAEGLLGMLYVRYPSGHGKRLSSVVLRDKLQQWRRG